MAIIGANSGTYTKADADRKRALAKQLMGSDFRARNPLGALAMSLEGGLSGVYDKEASGAEAAGNKQIAELLAGKDYAGVLGNEWANPQQAALASMLQGREWNQQDQQANWAREDARFAQQQAVPDWEFFESGGDRYRFNAKDPNSDPELFFDGPDAAPEPPRIEEAFDPVTGRPIKKQWGGEAGWQDFGGVAAPKDPLVTVNTGETSDGALNKALSTKEGESWATIKDAGMVAGAMAQDLALLDELIKVAPQGPIIGPLAETFKGFSSAGDAFQSIVKRVAPSLRTPGSGATSDIEYQGFLDSLPALKNSPEGNMLINQIMKSKAAINKQRSDIVTAYQAGDLSAEQARAEMARLNSASIVTPEMRQALAGVGAGEPSAAPEVGAVVEGFVYEGGDPSLQSSWRKL
jgi:hypothetical protein